MNNIIYFSSVHLRTLLQLQAVFVNDVSPVSPSLPRVVEASSTMYVFRRRRAGSLTHVVLTWPDLRGSRENVWQQERGEGGGRASSHLRKRPLMYTEHMPNIHSCPQCLLEFVRFLWRVVMVQKRESLRGLERLRNRDEERELLLELIHVRFLRRRECAQESERDGGRKGGGERERY